MYHMENTPLLLPLAEEDGWMENTLCTVLCKSLVSPFIS